MKILQKNVKKSTGNMKAPNLKSAGSIFIALFSQIYKTLSTYPCGICVAIQIFIASKYIWNRLIVFVIK